MPTVQICRQSQTVQVVRCANVIAGVIDNTIPRAFTYPNPATFPTIPVGYTTFYTDQDAALWYAPANSGTWTIVNTVG